MTIIPHPCGFAVDEEWGEEEERDGTVIFTLLQYIKAVPLETNLSSRDCSDIVFTNVLIISHYSGSRFNKYD